ncbi:MAG: HD domain-containing protein [Patescibacteria group bacterium]|nr:HD domain-containing protein [Patescibacteria group bacterium]
MSTYQTPPIPIHVPTDPRTILAQALERVNKNVELQTLWRILNVHAMDRLGMSDHGPVHFQIVANIGIKLLRMLHKHKVSTAAETDFGLTFRHAELIVLLGSLLHDLGMSVDREDHELHSIFLAHEVMKDILAFLPVDEQVIVRSETLHAIYAHRKGGTPLTTEAGVVRVADALDMSQGRSRIPYENGKINIHSLSAYAIDGVEIREGESKPIRIEIVMNNSSGIFQVDELLKKKLKNSGIEQYIEVKAYIKDEREKLLLKEFVLEHI